MISALFLGISISVITTVFSFFPHVETLPTIAGVDLDTVIVGGIASMMRLANVFWWVGDVVQGFLYISGYFLIKATIKFLAGIFQNVGGAALN